VTKRTFHAKTPAEKKDLAAYLEEHAPAVLEDLKSMAEVLGPFPEIYLELFEEDKKVTP
jgi:hypothetical protein